MRTLKSIDGICIHNTDSNDNGTIKNYDDVYKWHVKDNGWLDVGYDEVIEYIDIIALDFKLPSSTGLRPFWQEHEQFLSIASQKEAFVKAVICHSTEACDIEKAAEILGRLDKNIPLVLQPNTFELSHSLMDKLNAFKKLALGRLSDVRVVPQVHKLVGIK